MTIEWDALIEILIPDVKHIECVDDKEARVRIVSLFCSKPGMFFIDQIASETQLSISQVVRVCDHMTRDGLIGYTEGRGYRNIALPWK